MTVSIEPVFPRSYWVEGTRIPTIKGISKYGAAFEFRTTYVRDTAWCVLTQEVALILGELLWDKNVVEVFAGTGHVAHHLRRVAGKDRKTYRAYDNFTFSTRYRYPNSVSKKNAFRAPIKDADVVLMTWPEYNKNHAERVVKKMEVDQILVFNGEPRGGCTGNDAFYDLLEKDFVPMEGLNDRLDDAHYQFPGIHDWWSVHLKVN